MHYHGWEGLTREAAGRWRAWRDAVEMVRAWLSASDGVPSRLGTAEPPCRHGQGRIGQVFGKAGGPRTFQAKDSKGAGPVCRRVHTATD